MQERQNQNYLALSKEQMKERHQARPEKYVNPEERFVVHPDILDAYLAYAGSGASFAEIFEARRQLVEDGNAYWETDHDIEMTETARERSQQPGWRFKRRRNAT